MKQINEFIDSTLSFISANQDALTFVAVIIVTLVIIVASADGAQKELDKNAEKIKKDAKDMDEITNGKKNRSD